MMQSPNRNRSPIIPRIADTLVSIDLPLECGDLSPLWFFAVSGPNETPVSTRKKAATRSYTPRPAPHFSNRLRLQISFVNWISVFDIPAPRRVPPIRALNSPFAYARIRIDSRHCKQRVDCTCIFPTANVNSHVRNRYDRAENRTISSRRPSRRRWDLNRLSGHLRKDRPTGRR